MIINLAIIMSKSQGDVNGIKKEGKSSNVYDAIIVGAGAAGIGVAITLQHVGIENFIVVDRDTICLLYTSDAADE